MSLKAQQQHEQQRPLHILITGSSQGIGLAAAQQLIQQGHIVYHACRTQQRAEEAVVAAGGGVALKACDLADFNSIRDFGKDVQRQVPRLDVLCLNAGMAPSTSRSQPPFLTQQGYEPTIGINHLGHFLLAQLLIRKLTSHRDSLARIVITASSVHDPELKAGQSGGRTAHLGDMSGLGVNLKENPKGAVMIDGDLEFYGSKAYKDSKLCNILMCRHATKVFRNVDTVCFNPGFVPTTGLFETLRQESWWKAQALMLLSSVMGFSIPVEVAGSRLVYMALAKSIPNGAYYSAPAKSKGTTPEDGFTETVPSKDAQNGELASKLWKKSQQCVGKWT